MAGYWDTNLLPASFAGVAFPVGERQVSGGRSFARHRPTFAGGQRVQDTGRDPYVVALAIPLFRSVSSAFYPERYEQLRAALDDPETSGEGEYVDPELGSFRAKVATWKWRTVPDLRDGGIFEVVLEEVTDDSAPIPEAGWRSPPATRSTLLARGDEVDAEMGSLGVTDDDQTGALSSAGVPLEGTPERGAVTRQIMADVVDRVQDVRSTVDRTAAAVEYGLQQLSTIGDLALSRSPDSWVAWGATQDAAFALRSFGEDALRRSTPLVTVEIPALGLSAYEIAARLYGDLSRADEVIALSTGIHPLFLSVGSTVRAPLR